MTGPLDTGQQADPGHLLPDEAWQAVLAEAERQGQRITAGQRAAEAPDFRQLDDIGFRTSPVLRTVGLDLELDGAVYAPSNGGLRAGVRPTFGVLHSAETPLRAGFAAAIARYFSGGTGTSCHYMSDPAELWGVLPDERIAWHCGNGNTNSLALEQSGYASMSRAEWLSADGQAQMARNGEVMRAARDRFGIGLYWMSDAQLLAAHRRAIVGGWATHDQCRRVLGGTTHTDPLPGFPLDVQMELARAGEDDMPFTEAQLRKIVREEVANALIEPSPGGIGGDKPRRLAAFVGRIADDASTAAQAAGSDPAVAEAAMRDGDQ